jgi:Phosphoinositide phospholipase C, Ca2+-dependent
MPVDKVRINHVQVIGTHNSYHLRSHESLRTLMMKQAPALARGLDYSHGDTAEARANDTRCRDQALASRAQFISTDYPEPNPAFTPYAVRFENGIVVRVNPVNGDPSLRGIDLENGRR